MKQIRTTEPKLIPHYRPMQRENQHPLPDPPIRDSSNILEELLWPEGVKHFFKPENTLTGAEAVRPLRSSP